MHCFGLESVFGSDFEPQPWATNSARVVTALECSASTWYALKEVKSILSNRCSLASTCKSLLRLSVCIATIAECVVTLNCLVEEDSFISPTDLGLRDIYSLSS